jgi:hypothetical protein
LSRGPTDKMRVFTREYLRTFNATASARAAGYKDPLTSGQDCKRNPWVREQIRKNLEARAMDADEVLGRLADQARADYSAYIKPDGSVDLEQLLEDGKGHLIKSTQVNRDGELVITFYSSQRALELLAKNMGLLIERSEVHATVEVEDAAEARRRLAALIERRAEAGDSRE